MHDGDPPDVDRLEERSRHAWDELGAVIQIGPADGRRMATAASHDPRPGDEADERSTVRWRVPRPVRLWIWRTDEEGKPQLQSSAPALVLDELCDTKGLVLETRFFGEEGAQLQFGELGIPIKIIHGDKATAGVVAAAVGAVPERIVAGLDAASKTSTAFGGLWDAQDDRELAAAKHRLELARTEMEKAGVAATTEQFAELKRLEQSVAIGDARGKLAPPSELGELKARLELVQTRTAIRAAERADALDAELGDLKAQIERHEVRIEAAEQRSASQGPSQ